MDDTTTKQNGSKQQGYVAVMAAGIRVHAAVRGQGETLCGHPVASVGAAPGTGGVDCRLCSRIVGESKVVMRPRGR